MKALRARNPSTIHLLLPKMREKREKGKKKNLTRKTKRGVNRRKKKNGKREKSRRSRREKGKGNEKRSVLHGRRRRQSQRRALKRMTMPT